MIETDYRTIPSEERNFEKVPDTRYGYGIRHVQSFIFFLCLTICYISRGHLGVTIVAMTMEAKINITVNEEIHQTVNTSKQNNLNGNSMELFYNTAKVYESNLNEIIKPEQWTIYKRRFLILDMDMALGMYIVSYFSYASQYVTYPATYNWPKSTQEMVLGSFFLGYCIMMFPMGVVCQKWGGKLPIQIAMASNTILSVLTPLVVVWGGWKALCFFRIIQGMSQAGLFPGIHTLLANWLPASERGSLTSYVYTGSNFGTVLAFQFSGILAYSRFGWPSIFWLVSATSLAGFLLLTYFVAATPNTHRSLTIQEKTYIEGGVGKGVATNAKTPWRSILYSAPAWAIFMAHTGSGVFYIFFYMQVPTYMNAILKFDIRKNGVLSSLPYIAMILSSFTFGYLSDFCTNRKILSFKTARKLSNSIATLIPTICVTLVTFTSNTTLAVFYFVMSLAGNAIMHVGWMVNYMDISPNYSGALMAFGNTITNALVLVVPVLISNIVTDVTNQSQWRTIMFIMGGIAVITNLIFVVFMSTDVQPWNYVNDSKKETEAEEIALKFQQKNTESQ